jgi:hypothetical protein
MLRWMARGIRAVASLVRGVACELRETLTHLFTSYVQSYLEGKRSN